MTCCCRLLAGRRSLPWPVLTLSCPFSLSRRSFNPLLYLYLSIYLSISLCVFSSRIYLYLSPRLSPPQQARGCSLGEPGTRESALG